MWRCPSADVHSGIVPSYVGVLPVRDMVVGMRIDHPRVLNLNQLKIVSSGMTNGSFPKI